MKQEFTLMKIFLAILLWAGGTSAWADTYTDTNGLTYTFTLGEETCSITDCETTVSGHLDIHRAVTINGHIYSITSIGQRAFEKCSAITSIYIYEGFLTSIGSYAFRGCTALKTINIPTGVTIIDGSTFAECSALTNVSLPEGITSIGVWAFYKCPSLSYVRIPQSVTDIANYAFNQSSGLVIFKSTIPPALPAAGPFANFWGQIIVPLGCGEAYRTAATAFSSVADQIVEMATSEDLPHEFTYNDADSTCSLTHGARTATSVDVPTQLVHEGKIYKVTSIGDDAFMNRSLSSINIPEGIDSIGSGAFSHCSYLKSIILPESLKSLGSGAFSGCKVLTSIKIPEGIETIGSLTFSDCSALKAITLPANLDSIGWYAFENCSATILFNGTTPPANNSESTFTKFSGEIVVPLGSAEAYRAVYPTVADKIAEEPSPADFSHLLFAYNDTDKTCRVTYCNSATTSVELPTRLINNGNVYTLTSIGNEAFAHRYYLSYINIPNSVTSIGSGAFINCSALTSINIPKGVTKLETNTFLGWSSLTSVILPEGIEAIGNKAFYGCSALSSIYIPGNVTTFGDYIFNTCDMLEKIFVPYDCVETIKSKLNSHTDKVVGTVDVELKNASIGGAYASAYYPFAVTLDEGDAKAYVGESLDDKILEMTETTEVAALNGFILRADVATTATLKIGATETAATSVLSGTTTEITLDDTNRNERLLFGVKKVDGDETATLGFFKPAASVTSIAANRAFLLNTDNVAFASIKFNFNATDIESVTTGEGTETLYNLQGIPVKHPAKGNIYIRNGKKFIVQ